MSHHPPDRKNRQNRAHKTLARSKLFLETESLSPAVVLDIPDKLKVSRKQGFELPTVEQGTQQAGMDMPDPSGVLIFGSSTKPGGGWLNGARAQEEDVSLCSSWGEQARLGGQGFYIPRGGLGGMGPDKILYARGMWLFDEYGWELAEPKQVDFISIAAPNLGNSHTAKTSREQLIDTLARRLAGALETWEKCGTKHVLLGAIGCGVFKWDGADSAAALGRAIDHHYLVFGKGLDIRLAMPDPALAKVFKQVLAHPETWVGKRGFNPRF